MLYSHATGCRSVRGRTITQYTCTRWNEHISLHTMQGRLGSAPLLSRMSTISVRPHRLAIYSGLKPSCVVDETIMYNTYSTCTPTRYTIQYTHIIICMIIPGGQSKLHRLRVYKLVGPHQHCVCTSYSGNTSLSIQGEPELLLFQKIHPL